MTDKKLFYQVIMLVTVKLAIIIAAAIFIFGPMRAKIDAASVEQHLLQSPSQETSS